MSICVNLVRSKDLAKAIRNEGDSVEGWKIRISSVIRCRTHKSPTLIRLPARLRPSRTLRLRLTQTIACSQTAVISDKATFQKTFRIKIDCPEHIIITGRHGTYIVHITQYFYHIFTPQCTEHIYLKLF